MFSLRNLLFLLISFFVLSSAKAVEIGVGTIDFSNLHFNQVDMFGQDVLVSASEPEGPISGIKSNSGTVWLAINDTTVSSGKGIIFYRSTNSGNNWTLNAAAITPAVIVDQMRMITAGDSTYCFFRVGGTVTRFNVVTNSIAQFTTSTAATNFDVVSTSSNSLYVYYATATTIFRSASTDGGFTWVGNQNVTSNVNPMLSRSATGDTITVLYRGAGGNNTTITRFRYRETAPGTIVTAGTSIAVLATGTTRTMYRAYRYGATEWIVYTEGDAPNTEVKCIISNNAGTSYEAPITISSPGTDNPVFGGSLSATGSFIGADVFFIRDSAGTANDKVMQTGAMVTSPNFPNPRIQISNFTPVAAFAPASLDLGNSDVGVAFVGQNGANRNVYWDRHDYITGVHQNSTVAENYSLKQNYPNPFNPSTTISFTIPKADFVTLKVYNSAGKEVRTLLNKKIEQGNYDINFDADNLSSGIYFYTLVSSNFTSTKKMMLVK